MYFQDKRKSDWEAKERRNNRLLAAYYNLQEEIEKELEQERKMAKLQGAIAGLREFSLVFETLHFKER